MQKTKKQKLYIIPGWGETARFKQSQEIIRWASQKYDVVPVRYISKKGVLPSENLKIVREQIKNPTNKSIVFGFSMGALFAYILASENKFKKAIICSISPILENDLDFYKLKDIHKLFIDREIKELKSLKYKKLKCPAIFMCGDKEGKEEIFRMTKLYEKNGGKMIIVRNQEHSMKGVYLEKVKNLLS